MSLILTYLVIITSFSLPLLPLSPPPSLRLIVPVRQLIGTKYCVPE